MYNSFGVVLSRSRTKNNPSKPMPTPTTSKSLPDQPDDNNPDAFQQKLHEMQARIAFLEAEINQLQPADIRPKLRSLAILCIAITLAAIPPALVVSDRWLGLLPVHVMRENWCQSTFLCETFLPSYFLVVFACGIGLLIFMFFQRHGPAVVAENIIVPLENAPVSQRQALIGLYFMIGSAWGFALVVLTSLLNHQYPGWDLVLVWLAFLTGCFLRSFPISSLLNSWKRDGEFWVALLLAHVSIVAVLAGYFGQPQIFWGTVLWLILAMANLWRFRQQVPLIFWMVSFALIVYTLNINAWWITVVGDEYSFHELAWKLAEKTSFTELGKVLFSATGVYGQHTFFSSLLQAIPMKFLGHENFSWRFSSLYISALGVGLFYLFCKTFISKRAALVAAFLLAVSSYVMSFGKIGYNNLQALFAFSLVLAISAWAVRSRLPLAFACLGSALALCFYVFAAALYVIPLSFLLLVLYYPPVTRQAVERWSMMIVVCLVMIYPLMLQPGYWQARVGGTFLIQPDLVQSSGAILKHFAVNILYSIVSFLYIAESHYIASSYLDPLTSVLFLIGFCVLLYQMRRQRFAIFVMLSYVFFLLSVGASHGYGTPPNTRMFMLLPLFALIATWGLMWIEEHVSQIRAGSMIFVPIVLLAITGANLYQAYPLSYTRYAGLQYIQSLFIRSSQNVYKAEPNIPKNYALIVNDVWGIDGLGGFQNIYPHLAWAEIYQVRITEPVLPESSLTLLTERNTIVILSPWLDPAWQAALDAPLRALGKQPCDIYTPDGQKRFILYHAPDLPQACAP